MGQSIAREKSPYSHLWRVVSGAVLDAFNRHPDYLTSKGKRSAAASIVKRVTGTVLSFAVQSAGAASAAEKGEGAVPTSAPADDDCVRHPLHSHAHVNERCYQAVRRALFPVGARAVRRDAKRFRRQFAAMTKKLSDETGVDAIARLRETERAR